jgi:UDP-glucose 4-epimerase
MTDPETDLEINCRAQLAILQTCRESNPKIKIVLASTRQIYGRPEYLPVDEKHLVRPVDVNGINKAAGEAYHILYNDVYGIRACALRLTNTYGPHMRVRDARQTFLGIWIRRLLEGDPFEVWEGGGLEVISLQDLAELLVRVAGSGSHETRTFPADRKRIDIGDYYSDDRLIRSTLGWEPHVRLEDGLARTLAFYRTHLERYV